MKRMAMMAVVNGRIERLFEYWSPEDPVTLPSKSEIDARLADTLDEIVLHLAAMGVE